MTKFQAKRIYDDASASDGFRVLVDRLWPRGVRKDDAEIDDWPKEIAPSNELRKRFHSDDDYDAFEHDYLAELEDNDDVEEIVKRMREHKTVSLITAAKNPDRSHVSVLLDWL